LRKGLGAQGNQGLINLWSHDRLAVPTESGKN
jgi:hypothetical protein